MDVDAEDLAIVAVTHDGSFHADDVFAYVVLSAAEPSISLRRSRDPRVIGAAAIVFDVGAEYDPSRGRYDHHMRERPARDDATPYSSFGLLWKDYGRAAIAAMASGPLLPEAIEAVWRSLDAGLVLDVDRIDNGVMPPTAGHVTELVSAFNSVWDASGDFDTAFFQAVAFGGGVLRRAIEHAAAVFGAIERVEAAARAMDDPAILVLDTDLPWEQALHALRLEKVLFVVFPDANKQIWLCRTVPSQPGSFTPRLRLPDPWAGLRDAAFATASGVTDSVFCHPGRFICGARSRAGAIELAHLSIALRVDPEISLCAS